MNKKKIINDPVYGFITIPNELIVDIIEHPYFQRLRRIQQLGISDLVYPGAKHSRFHHALGAMHLMGRALDVLRSKGNDISDQEYEAAQIAILLHDLGHGPFSHSLEFSLFTDIPHEQISLWMIESMNKEFGGQLSMALEIFSGTYPLKFLNQLVSSQLDIDRMDYLKRDSFFTGVQEGTIGSERIIKMLDLHEDQLVIEEKGIHSVENFLNARRLMYWQVYLHKAAVSADVMLIELIKRAKELASISSVQATPSLKFFLSNQINHHDFISDSQVLDSFCQLDDSDIYGSMKFWIQSDDFILKYLSRHILNRKLFAIKMTNNNAPLDEAERLQSKAQELFQIDQQAADHLVKTGTISNAAYIPKDQSINILMKSGKILDVVQATDLLNIKAISKIVKKHYLCYPKELTLSLN